LQGKGLANLVWCVAGSRPARRGAGRRGLTEIFAMIEQTPLSVWVREDLSAFFYILIVHAIGMALLVGGGVVVCLAMLAMPAGAPLHKLRGFFPVMQLGLALAVLSGLGLLVGYPAKALTNPVFALKFAFLVAAALLMWRMQLRLFPLCERGEELPDWRRPAAAAGLLLWACGVVAGKFLPYTHHILMVS